MLFAGLTACASSGGRVGADDPVVSPPTSRTAAPVACDYVKDGSTPAKDVGTPSTSDLLTPRTLTLDLTFTTDEKYQDKPVVIGLAADTAPCTVNSLAYLAGKKYFDGTVCHRLVSSGIFVLQCGDPTGSGSGGPGYAFADELAGTETYPAGTVAMANTGQPVSNGSQFFLVYRDSPLPPNYTVLGHMDAAGTTVVTQIAAQGDDGAFAAEAGGGHPNANVTITAAATT